jgi:KTSC domain
MMERKPVSSSSIKSIGFENGEMHIEFNNGRVYSYTGPKVQEHYEQLLKAPSIGKHFGANVRNCPHTKCTPL